MMLLVSRFSYCEKMYPCKKSDMWLLCFSYLPFNASSSRPLHSHEQCVFIHLPDTSPLTGGGICGSFLIFGALSAVCYKPWRRYVERKKHQPISTVTPFIESTTEGSTATAGEVEIELLDISEGTERNKSKCKEGITTACSNK